MLVVWNLAENEESHGASYCILVILQAAKLRLVTEQCGGSGLSCEVEDSVQNKFCKCSSSDTCIQARVQFK